MGIETSHSSESTPKPVVELFDPSTQIWGEVRGEILGLEDLCFPGKGFGEEDLKSSFENPQNVVELLRKAGKIIRFSYAIPDSVVDDALYIETTNIHPTEQGHGHVALLIAAIENEARKRGYRFLTRNAATENGYADKILKNYEGRILESHENDSEWGPQRYFKIAL